MGLPGANGSVGEKVCCRVCGACSEQYECELRVHTPECECEHHK